MANTCCGGSKVTAKVKGVSSCCSGGDSTSQKSISCGCGSETKNIPEISDNKLKANFITGHIKTPVGEVPQVATKLNFSDTLGSWKCRW